VFHRINNIYVNILLIKHVVMLYIQYNVQMDNVDNQLTIVLHNQFAHHNSHYVPIKLVLKHVHIINLVIVQMMRHLNAKINHVQFHQMNVLPQFHAKLKIKSFVLIILALIVFYNVKFQMIVPMEFYALINHVDLQLLNVQDKLLVCLDIHYVEMETVRNLVSKLKVKPHLIDLLDY